ncbi:unnamed protein product [Dibothriocephalus latus]|uniref:Notch ligand N-terminal domain-containing protein n=1 Tax=Dibothriocephalus latus TaxID=60516 RepID=A0A3P6UEW6_DIBLA|nr:unnamed protein product [Dibothriocephalus latus]
MLWIIFLTFCHPFEFMGSSAVAAVASPTLATLGIKLFYFENNLNFRLRNECCTRSRSDSCAEQCDLEFRLCFEDYEGDGASAGSSAWNGQCQYGAANITAKKALSKSSSSEGITTRVELTEPWPKLNKSTDYTVAGRRITCALMLSYPEALREET